MSGSNAFERRAHELRAAFDRSFAAPPQSGLVETEDLLAIRVGGDPYAVRLRDISGLIARRTLVAVPGGAAGLVGIAGIRGDIVPVFSLSVLLGYGEDAEPPPWTVLCGTEQPTGLGFAEFEGYLRLARSAVHADENLHAARKYVKELATTEAEARPVIAIPQILTDIRTPRGPQRSEKEQ